MIELYESNNIYIRTSDLITLKEAKIKDKWITFNKELDENTLGYVRKGYDSMCSDYFIPISYKGMLLK